MKSKTITSQKFIVLILLFLVTVVSSSGQNAVTNSDGKVHQNQYNKDELMAILIADSVAKSELKKISISHPNMMSDGQLSLKFYDKTVETLQKNINAFQVNYKFNQDIGGKVLFQSFNVIVNLDTKNTIFIKETTNEKRTFVGTAIISNGKPMFIWEFSDSQAFYLDGLKNWDNKYLNKKITVIGTLTEYIDGVYSGPVLKDWKIIESK